MLGEPALPTSLQLRLFCFWQTFRHSYDGTLITHLHIEETKKGFQKIKVKIENIEVKIENNAANTRADLCVRAHK